MLVILFPKNAWDSEFLYVWTSLYFSPPWMDSLARYQSLGTKFLLRTSQVVADENDVGLLTLDGYLLLVPLSVVRVSFYYRYSEFPWVCFWSFFGQCAGYLGSFKPTTFVFLQLWEIFFDYFFDSFLLSIFTLLLCWNSCFISVGPPELTLWFFFLKLSTFCYITLFCKIFLTLECSLFIVWILFCYRVHIYYNKK